MSLKMSEKINVSIRFAITSIYTYIKDVQKQGHVSGYVKMPVYQTYWKPNPDWLKNDQNQSLLKWGCIFINTYLPLTYFYQHLSPFN